MDFLNMRHVLPFLVPIMALMIPIVAIIMGIQAKMRREQLLHETLRQLADKGQPLPPELLNQLSGDGQASLDAQRRRTNGGLQAGAINVAAGLGLAVMFYLMNPGSWLWAIGCLPGFIGIAMLIVWRVETRGQKDAQAKV